MSPIDRSWPIGDAGHLKQRHINMPESHFLHVSRTYPWRVRLLRRTDGRFDEPAPPQTYELDARLILGSRASAQSVAGCAFLQDSMRLCCRWFKRTQRSRASRATAGSGSCQNRLFGTPPQFSTNHSSIFHGRLFYVPIHNPGRQYRQGRIDCENHERRALRATCIGECKENRTVNEIETVRYLPQELRNLG
jgi:hypothetical protein